MIVPGNTEFVRGKNVPYYVNGLNPFAVDNGNKNRDKVENYDVTENSRSKGENDKNNSEERDEVKDEFITFHECRIRDALNAKVVEIGMNPEEGLKKLAWEGVPVRYRGQVWGLLCEYLPTSLNSREAEHNRKVSTYSALVKDYFDLRSMSEQDQKVIIHQISVDMPRHKLAVFHVPELCKCIERSLYIWSLRYPSVGYVQGMDDIISVFFVAFLCDALEGSKEALKMNSIEICGGEDVEALAALTYQRGGPLTEELIRRAEADTYWCGGKMLSWLLNHFVNGLQGVHKMVQRLQVLLSRIDPVYSHFFESSDVNLHFTFQWMHCLLVRELPVPLVLRLLDTYLSIGEDFTNFHVYICCAILMRKKDLVLKHISKLNSSAILNALLDSMRRPIPNNANVSLIDQLIAEAYLLRHRFPL